MGFEFDKMPENTVLLPGESLLTGRHLPLSPDLTILIRNPQDPGLLYEILREEYPDSHPLSLYFPDSSKEITVKTLKEDAAILNGARSISWRATPPSAPASSRAMRSFRGSCRSAARFSTA